MGDDWYNDTYVPGKPALISAVPSTQVWRSNSLLSEGTVYAYVWVLPKSQVDASSLASKAEETYTMNLPVADMPYWYDLTAAVTGTASDFHNEFERYPIRADINWQLLETGLIIDSLEINNYSRSFVNIERVSFVTNLDRVDMIPPETIVGINGKAPGVILMPISFQPSEILDTTMIIRLSSSPSFPGRPYISILMQAGAVPAPGCSFPVK